MNIICVPKQLVFPAPTPSGGAKPLGQSRRYIFNLGAVTRRPRLPIPASSEDGYD